MVSQRPQGMLPIAHNRTCKAKGITDPFAQILWRWLLKISCSIRHKLILKQPFQKSMGENLINTRRGLSAILLLPCRDLTWKQTQSTRTNMNRTLFYLRTWNKQVSRDWPIWALASTLKRKTLKCSVAKPSNSCRSKPLNVYKNVLRFSTTRTRAFITIW